MKLPNHKSAYIPQGKLENYLLSETHQVGASKAKFFRSLGFHENNLNKLKQELLKIAFDNEIISTKETIYGINYLVKGLINSPKHKKVSIKTVWFIESEKVNPRFVTTIPDIISTRKKA